MVWPGERTHIKNIKLQPVPPSMPSEALSVLFLDIHSASSGIDGGTGCNFIFFYTRVHTIETYYTSNKPLYSKIIHKLTHCTRMKV